MAAELRAAPHDTHGRMVFDWKSAVRYTAEVTEGRLVLKFTEPVRDDPRRVLTPLRDYVADVQVSDDRKTLTFPLKGDFPVNSFTIGSAVVVDLMKEQGAGPPQGASPAGQPTASVVKVRTGSHSGYFRLVFDWPRPVDYSVDGSDGTARLSFRQKAAVDLNDLRRQMPRALKDVAAETTENGLVVSLPIPPDGGVRHFKIGPRIVVDLLNKAPAAADGKKAEPAVADKVEQQPSQPPLPAEAAAALPPAPAPESESKAAQSAGEQKETAQASELPVPQAAEPESAPHAPAVEADPPQPQAQAQAVSLNAEAAAAVTAQAAMAQPVQAAEEAPEEVQTKVASLSFSWAEQTAAAVFERAGYLWVVFDRHQEVDLKLLERLGGDIVHFIEQRPSTSATVIRMIVEPGYNPSLRREGLLWIVDLMRQPYRPVSSVEIQTQAQSPVGPRLYLPVPEAGRAMVMEDPEVGDRFIVVPVVPLGYGLGKEHAYPDADLPVTAQGFVVDPHSDRIVVNATRNGIEVSAQGGLTFSPDTERMQALAKVGTQNEMTRVLEVNGWMRGPEEDFLYNKQLLQLAVAQASANRINPARLELARFYFAHGYWAEALGVLRLISESSPEMASSAAFRALRGGANLFMARYEEAVSDLSHPSLDDVEEAAFWRAAAQAQMSSPELQALTLRDYGGLLGNYPRRIKIPLAIMAAEATVAASDDLATTSFLTAARARENTTHELAAIGYIEGRLAEGRGAYQDALNAWGDVADSSDRYYGALAKRDLFELLFRMQEIDRDQLIDGLETLRFAWRGGDFEFKLLMRLGDLYNEAGAYDEALRLWKQVVVYFKGRDEAKLADQRMREVFDTLYHQGAADELPPLRAIALFDEFRDLTPVGERGDEMIRRLADRLVSVDLLEQAALLLERQVRYRLDGVEKARVGARLGLVYLLDRKPREALQALLDTKAGDLPDDVERQRRQLTARALADMGRPVEAVALLEGDDTRDAQLLRTEIHWKQEDWKAVAASIEAMVPPGGALALTSDQARMILDWATALTLAQDERKIQDLRRRYMEAMSATPLKDAFDLITTSPERGVIDHRTVAERIKQAQDFRSFLTAYRERLRADGLSAIN